MSDYERHLSATFISDIYQGHLSGASIADSQIIPGDFTEKYHWGNFLA
jgi:hypothetical protein